MRLNGWAWVYLATFTLDVVLMALDAATGGQFLPFSVVYLAIGAAVTALLVAVELNRAMRRDAPQPSEQGRGSP